MKSHPIQRLLLFLLCMSCLCNFSSQRQRQNLALAWVTPSTYSSFSKHWQRTPTTNQKWTCNVVFTRLSEDCISALSQAQEQARQLQQSQIDEASLLFGLCQHPGDITTTLTHFQITAEKVKDVLNSFQPTTTRKVPRLSDFNTQSPPPELPLSTEIQLTLFQAGTMSTTMGKTAIQPSHILLALLKYREDGPDPPQAATRSDNCEAMKILHQFNSTLEAKEICFHLMESLTQQERESKSNTGTTFKKKPSSSTASDNSKKEPIVSGTGAAMSEAKEKARLLLQECGFDLTLLARQGELDKVHGRDKEIQACFQTLVRRRKNNVCLIGEAGVGKTCIVEALAQALVSPECPPFLEGHRIISLEVGALLAGTKFRGEFEERLRSIIEILTSSRTKSILFIDEIHNLVGAGGNSEGNLDASNILKPYLARGQLQVIGATTITEYNRYIAKDAALERRFQPVLVREPSVDATVDILKAIVPFYRGHHRVEYTSQALEAAARLSDRYINDRFLPDKAIDILDEAGAMANLRRNRTDLFPPSVTEKSITDIISQWTNIPVGKLEIDEMDRLKLLEENLERRVKGQERAVRIVARAIRRARTGIRNPRRPVASFLFCGPTGTGKTELCKALADTYYGSGRDLIRIDMSEYMEKSSISRLTGPPPGLVGYEEGGQLTEAVRRSPHSVVLLDELEKAHVDVLNILLQVMEDGILTDGKGRAISFKNTVLIMTSNIGSTRILELVRKREGGQSSSVEASMNADVGRAEDDRDGPAAVQMARDLQRIEYERQLERLEYNKLARVVKGELEKKLKPEFLNRIDDIVVFQPLTANELSLIASIMVMDIIARAKSEKDIDIEVTSELLDTMVRQGSLAASQFGARPMRRAIQRILEDAISDAVIENFLSDGDVATFGRIGSIGDDVVNDEDAVIVTVTRERDGEILEISIDESSRDLAAMVGDEDGVIEDLSANGDFYGETENDYAKLEMPPV